LHKQQRNGVKRFAAARFQLGVAQTTRKRDWADSVRHCFQMIFKNGSISCFDCPLGNQRTAFPPYATGSDFESDKMREKCGIAGRLIIDVSIDIDVWIDPLRRHKAVRLGGKLAGRRADSD
jgi:hypothetical protein